MSGSYNVYNLKFDEVTNETVCDLQLNLDQVIAGASSSVIVDGDYELSFGPEAGVLLANLPAGDQRMVVRAAVSASAGSISGTLTVDPAMPEDVTLSVLGGDVIATLTAGETEVTFSQSVLSDWTIFTEEEVVQMFALTSFEAVA